MVAHKTSCDRERLEQLMSDSLTAPALDETHRHLETCVECRRELEAMAADEAIWRDMPRFLRMDDSDPETPLASRDATHLGDDEPIASLSIDTVVDQLEPSDNPAMLGRMGEYDILEVVGEGGMGVVLKGYDRDLNRYVAIKVLAPHFAPNAAARKRFAREAKAAAAVVHPHVVSIFRVADANNLPYFVMQFVAGQSLQQRIESDAPLDVKDVLRIASQSARGLAAAHAQGLVHRDIKPANILLENGVERVLLSDFGLARAADDASMTQSGIIAGTPQFMSPEQARGDAIDARSDLFSLGSVIYAMCTGHSPFRAETTMGVLSRIQSETPRPLQQINPDTPHWLQGIVEMLLAKDAVQRFQSAEQVATVLEDWLAHVQQPNVIPEPALDPPSLSAPPSGPQQHSASSPLPDRAYEPSRPTSSSGPSRAWRRWTATVVGWALLIAAATIIVLESGKGTLTIKCEEPDVRVRITQNGKFYRRMMVTQRETELRVQAGKYVVHLDGPYDGLEVDDGTVTLKRGGDATVRIVHETEPKSPQGDAPPQERQVSDNEKERVTLVEDADDGETSDKEAAWNELVGTWRSVDKDGRAATLMFVGTVTRPKMRFVDVGGRTQEGPVAISTRSTTNRLSVTTVGLDRVTRTWFARYEVSEDSLKLEFRSVNVRGGRRHVEWVMIPEEPSSPRRMKATYKKVDPADLNDVGTAPVAEELVPWQGLWTLVRSEPTGTGRGPITMQIQNDDVSLQWQTLGASKQPKCRLVLDDANPGRDFTFEALVPIWGIYKFNDRGDRLTIAYRKSDSKVADERPDSFSIDGDGDRVICTFQRAPRWFVDEMMSGREKPAITNTDISGEEVEWQGIWTTVRTEPIGSQRAPVSFTVRGNHVEIQWQLAAGINQPNHRLVLDKSTSPARFKLDGLVPIWGIYKFNDRGDRLTLSFREHSSEKADVVPDDFELGTDRDRIVCILQRAPQK